MKINYIKNGDYYLPDLNLNEEKQENIGRYGILRLRYIKENKKELYTHLLMTNKLNYHLRLINEVCETRFKVLMEDFIKNDKRLTEKSKAKNGLEWTKIMNNYKNAAEEMIMSELIYV